MVRYCFTHIMQSQAPPGRGPRRQPCHWPTRASPRPRAVPCDATAAMSKVLEELVRNLRSGKKYVILETTIFWMSMLRYDMFWIIIKDQIYIMKYIYTFYTNYHTLNNINKILKRENPHCFLSPPRPPAWVHHKRQRPKKHSPQQDSTATTVGSAKEQARRSLSNWKVGDPVGSPGSQIYT